jgi:DNA-directed RNA polymerase subunit H
MHVLQPKYSILSEEEAKELLEKYNIDKLQLPKIKLKDPSLPKGAKVGNIIKIERKIDENKKSIYFRVVVP